MVIMMMMEGRNNFSTKVFEAKYYHHPHHHHQEKQKKNANDLEEPCMMNKKKEKENESVKIYSHGSFTCPGKISRKKIPTGYVFCLSDSFIFFCVCVWMVVHKNHHRGQSMIFFCRPKKNRFIRIEKIQIKQGP